MNNNRHLHYLIFIFILLLGCTNRYINNTYFKKSFGDRKLTVLPPRIDDLIISDSTLLDFISEDFNIKKDSALVILDSLIHWYMERAFISNTDNILVVKSPFSKSLAVRQNAPKNIPDTLSASSYRKLQRLGITIPSRQHLLEAGINADMAILLGKMDLDISFEVETFFGIPKGYPRYELEAENLAYAIWDYNENRLVSCDKLDISTSYPRCDQIKTYSTHTCDNKNFWRVVLLALGSSVVSETPFDKQIVDSIMDKSSWKEMKELQFREPLRDSAALVLKAPKLCHVISAYISKNDTLFHLQDTLRFRCTITPAGKVSSVYPLDSLRIDSTSLAGLKNQLDIQIFDPIENQRNYTTATVEVAKSSPNKCILYKVHSGELRSKASIMKVVMTELPKLRYAYNRRLADGMDKSGKITVKFMIDEFGNVASASIVESTIGDTMLENEITSIIRSWRFGRIYNRGDTCEVVYPFVFSKSW